MVRQTWSVTRGASGRHAHSTIAAGWCIRLKTAADCSREPALGTICDLPPGDSGRLVSRLRGGASRQPSGPPRWGAGSRSRARRGGASARETGEDASIRRFRGSDLLILHRPSRASSGAGRERNRLNAGEHRIFTFFSSRASPAETARGPRRTNQGLVVKLADTQHLGCCARKACGFESRPGHPRGTCRMMSAECRATSEPGRATRVLDARAACHCVIRRSFLELDIRHLTLGN